MVLKSVLGQFVENTDCRAKPPVGQHQCLKRNGEVGKSRGEIERGEGEGEEERGGRGERERGDR